MYIGHGHEFRKNTQRQFQFFTFVRTIQLAADLRVTTNECKSCSFFLPPLLLCRTLIYTSDHIICACVLPLYYSMYYNISRSSLHLNTSSRHIQPAVE